MHEPVVEIQSTPTDLDLSYEASALTSEPATWTIHEVRELVANPPPESPFLIDGMIRQGDRVVIAGPRSSGKSWLAMQLAHALAGGTGAFLGFPVSKQSNVLVIHGESSPPASARRWQLLTDGDVPDGLYESFDPFAVRVIERRIHFQDLTRNRSVTERDDLARIIGPLEEVIREYGIRVLIVDPWAVFFQGDENSNDQTEMALACLTDLMRRYELTVVIVHHFAKPGRASQEPEDRWRGASRLPDWASLRVTMTAQHTAQAAKQLKLRRAEARRFATLSFLTRGEDIDEFNIERDPVSQRWHRDLFRPTETWAGLSPTEVAEACEEAGGWASTNEAAKSLGVAQATAKALLGAAQVAGLIESHAGARRAQAWAVTSQFALRNTSQTKK